MGKGEGERKALCDRERNSSLGEGLFPPHGTQIGIQK